MRSFKKFVIESIEQAELDEAVEVRHDRYMRSHGKKASGGTGSWMFTHKAMGDVDHKNEKEVYSAPSGKFSDAKKAAQQWAKKHGHSTVYVMESVESIEEGKWNYPKDITGSKPDVYWDQGNTRKKEARKAHRKKIKAKAHAELIKGKKKTNEEVELEEAFKVGDKVTYQKSKRERGNAVISSVSATKKNHFYLKTEKEGTIMVPGGELELAESVELDEAVTVKKKNYSWGKMMTVHHGSSHSFPLHPEHQEKIKKLGDREKTSFRDETGSVVTAHREGDKIHLKHQKENLKTTVARSHFTESVELDEANKNIIPDRELNNLVKSKKAVYWRSSGFNKLPNDKFFYIPILDKNKKMLGVYKANANDSDQEYEYLDSMLKDVRESVELDEVSDKMLDRYRQKAFADQPSGDDGSDKYRKRKFGRDLAFAKQTGRAKVLATKEEVELDEKAPKIKPDFLKTQREKDAEHAKAMGRSVKTGRKLPMTSTQRSLAKMRGESKE
jgi:hypothetical protein